ncbi:hypothetical protein [Chitinophaga sp. YR573]|uniref:hypothetical protein n=1 Tax=Chitinophaga sp. YR573 TaxID=1881040 RepID=UPI000B7EC738|nr:hypothetical protein [Chitinophaga sp. YR573]
MSDPLVPGANNIYIPTMEMAWQQLDILLHHNIRLTNKTAAAIKALAYSPLIIPDNIPGSEVEASAENGEVNVKATMYAELPFKHSFDTIQGSFGNKKVKYFGITYSYEYRDYIDILSYKDEKHFIVSITPQDTSKEILFCMGYNQFHDFNKLYKSVNIDIADAKKKESWRTSFMENDGFSAPKINFDLTQQLSSVQGQQFRAGKETYTITNASLRNAFLLTEKGATVFNEADMMAALDSIPVKRMIFDSPYTIILRKKTSPQPFAMMTIADTELMTLSANTDPF